MRDLSAEERAANEAEWDGTVKCPNPKCEDGWLDGEEEGNFQDCSCYKARGDGGNPGCGLCEGKGYTVPDVKCDTCRGSGRVIYIGWIR